MGFTVMREGGTKDIEFEAYARLLRQKGVDLSNLPRVPEPGTNRRWLSVWSSQAEAQEFAAELQKRTGDGAWAVVEVDSPISEGPLGPVEVQVGRQTNGWTFALHPLSRQMVQQVFPGSCRVPHVFIAKEIRPNGQTTLGDLAALTDQVAIILTGVDLSQIKEKFGGYRVYDPVAKKELVAAEPIQA